jgi:hypothetical protein
MHQTAKKFVFTPSKSVIYSCKIMNKKLLLKYLEVYFDEIDLTNPRITSTCPVARLIKTRLSACNRWKNQSRGKPNMDIGRDD